MPIYVDVSRCIGCRSCEVACKRVHGGTSYITVEIAEDLVSVPLTCHHCEEAMCATACYSGALTKDGDRTVFDLTKCTGCGLCALACPFGIVRTDRYAHKCDHCAGRETPVCVTTCPGHALSSDYDLAVSRARSVAAVAIAKGGRS